MAVRPQPSIEEQGGIRTYLDDRAAEHHGFGYDRFDLFCKLKLPNTTIAVLMNIRTVDTVKNWKAHREALLKSEAGESN